MNEFLEQINNLNKKTIDDILDILEKEEKIYNSYCDKEKKLINKGNLFFENIEKEILNLIITRTENYETLKKVIETKKNEYNKVVEESIVNESIENEIKKFQKTKGMSIKSTIEPLKRKIQEAESQLTLLDKDVSNRTKDIKLKKDEFKKINKAKLIEIKKRFDKEMSKLNKDLDAKSLPLEQEMSPEKNKKRILDLKKEIKKIRLVGLSEEKGLRIKNLKEKEMLEKEYASIIENLDLDLELLEIHYERRSIELKSIQKNLQLEIECEQDLYDYRSVIKSNENIKTNYFDSLQKKISITDEINDLKKTFLDSKDLEENDKLILYTKTNEYFNEFQKSFLSNIEKFSNDELNKNLNGFNVLKNSLINYLDANYLILEKMMFQYYEYKNNFLLALVQSSKDIKNKIENYDNFNLEMFLMNLEKQIKSVLKKQQMFLNEFKIELKTIFKEMSKFINKKFEFIIDLYKCSISSDVEMIAEIETSNNELIRTINEANSLKVESSKRVIDIEKNTIEKTYLDTINELDALKIEFENKFVLETSSQQMLIDKREKEFLLAKGSEIIKKGDIILEIDKKEQALKIQCAKKIEDLVKKISSKFRMQIVEIEKDISEKIKML